MDGLNDGCVEGVQVGELLCGMLGEPLGDMLGMKLSRNSRWAL